MNVKITTKIIEEVVSELAGSDVVPLVTLLRNKVNVSEFSLATGMKAEINQTRNMLYRLYDHNLVTFTRKKDKKKGWYIYFWTFNQKRIRDLIVEIRKKRLERMTERLEREKNNQFFICENKCIRLDFEQSHDYNFKCPECGQLLNVHDNQKTIANLEEQLKILEAEVKEAEEIIEAPVKKPSKPAKKKEVKKAPTKKKIAQKKTTKPAKKTPAKKKAAQKKQSKPTKKSPTKKKTKK